MTYSLSHHKTGLSVKLTSWLKTCSTHKEPIDVGLLRQFVTVLLVHAAAVYDSGLLSNFLGDGFGEPIADRFMDFLCLFCVMDQALACIWFPQQ